jgi:hypothetical protein
MHYGRGRDIKMDVKNSYRNKIYNVVKSKKFQ